MKFSISQISRQGGRPRNEDRMGYAYTRDAGLLVLADGMGGHPKGAVAAQMALQTFSAYFQSAATPRLRDVPSFLTRALLAAHHHILSYAAAKAMPDTPRTTLVAAVMQGHQLHWIHCGDSRLYIIRHGEVLVRTRDHSYIEQRSRMKLPVDNFNRNVLFTCLGSPVRPLFDLGGPVTLEKGDRVLLCSDGLWGQVRDDDIVDTLCSLSLEDAVSALVDQALRRGGRHSDNVTLLAIEWETANASETSRVSTEAMAHGLFASSVQAPLPAAAKGVSPSTFPPISDLDPP